MDRDDVDEIEVGFHLYPSSGRSRSRLNYPAEVLGKRLMRGTDVWYVDGRWRYAIWTPTDSLDTENMSPFEACRGRENLVEL